MRFIIKNITGDSNNVNKALRLGRTLYACSDHVSNTLPVGPGETVSVSAKAYNELLISYPDWIQVIDSDGSPDIWAPFRKDVVLVPSTWTLVDFGRIAQYIELHNHDAAIAAKWSFSGYTSPDVAPAASAVSDLDAGETLQFWNAMNPMRYIYLYSTAAITIKILVD